MKHIKLFESWINESIDHAIDMVMNACGEFEHNYPQGLDKLCSANADQIMDNEELQELYNQAAGCIIEPDQMLSQNGRSVSDISDYYHKCESEGLSFVKNYVRELPNGDKWFCIIDLIDEIGY